MDIIACVLSVALATSSYSCTIRMFEYFRERIFEYTSERIPVPSSAIRVSFGSSRDRATREKKALESNGTEIESSGSSKEAGNFLSAE